MLLCMLRKKRSPNYLKLFEVRNDSDHHLCPLASRIHTYSLPLQLQSLGLLVPDIPLEETTDIRAVCNSHGIELVLLSTPTTPPARMAAIAKMTQGFMYLVSVTGVTGVQENMEKRVEGLIQSLHDVTDKSVSPWQLVLMWFSLFHHSRLCHCIMLSLFDVVSPFNGCRSVHGAGHADLLHTANVSTFVILAAWLITLCAQHVD